MVIKRIMCMLLSVVLLFAFVGCKTGNDDTQNVHYNEFDQVSFANGSIIYGGGPHFYYVNNCNEIIAVFAHLTESGKLNRFTYAFNLSATEISLCYTLNSLTLGDKCIEDITDALDFLSCSGKVHLSTSLTLEDTICTLDTQASSVDTHVAHLSLIFDRTQPEPPRIINNALLSYRQTDSFEISEEHYFYEVLYDGQLLFYIKSCVEIDNDIFTTIFVNSLVQYDLREKRITNTK